jgi:hypothetical protein
MVIGRPLTNSIVNAAAALTECFAAGEYVLPRILPTSRKKCSSWLGEGFPNSEMRLVSDPGCG